MSVAIIPISPQGQLPVKSRSRRGKNFPVFEDIPAKSRQKGADLESAPQKTHYTEADYDIIDAWYQDADDDIPSHAPWYLYKKIMNLKAMVYPVVDAYV